MTAYKPVLAHGEVHQPLRQALMRQRASALANEFSKHQEILAVLLAGSSARGPVGPASDLDLYVIVSDSFSRDLSRWTFRQDGFLEDVKQVKEGLLAQGHSLIDQTLELASWFYQSRWIGDELFGYEPLYWNPATRWQKSLPLLLSYRTQHDVVYELSKVYANEALALVTQAEKALKSGAPMDSHQTLRWAAQLAMIAVLVRTGSIVRGSKKRIEIMEAHKTYPYVEHVLAISSDIVGLNSLTASNAVLICRARLAYRQTEQIELSSLIPHVTRNDNIHNGWVQTRQQHQRHNSNAFDYYLPLLDKGFIYGPINHIRAISGFSRSPAKLLGIIGYSSKWSIQSFLDHPSFTDTIKREWLEIADLTVSTTQCSHWIQELRLILKKL